jgi:hypothetical protein
MKNASGKKQMKVVIPTSELPVANAPTTFAANTIALSKTEKRNDAFTLACSLFIAVSPMMTFYCRVAESIIPRRARKNPPKATLTRSSICRTNHNRDSRRSFRQIVAVTLTLSVPSCSKPVELSRGLREIQTAVKKRYLTERFFGRTTNGCDLP